MRFDSFDKDYVERLRAGDFRTQEHFVSYFSELIRLKLSKRMQFRSEVEDGRQETFARVLAALRKEDGIREPERLGAFVNSVINNVLLEHFRRVKSSQSGASDDDDAGANIPDPAISVVDIIAERQMQRKVRQVLESLQEKDRRLLEAVLLEERDKDEVCRELGVDREYLRVLLHRSKKSFKDMYLKKIAKEAMREK